MWGLPSRCLICAMYPDLTCVLVKVLPQSVCHGNDKPNTDQVRTTQVSAGSNKFTVRGHMVTGTLRQWGCLLELKDIVKIYPKSAWPSPLDPCWSRATVYSPAQVTNSKPNQTEIKQTISGQPHPSIILGPKLIKL